MKPLKQEREHMEKRISFGAKVSILLRSLFIQAGWNYKGMISMGFGFALAPLARMLYKNDPAAYNAFLRRHLGFFNAHPYFASYALGAIVRLEEDIAAGKASVDQEEHFKNALIGPLGALGDQLFWGVIRPAVFAFGVLGYYLYDDTKDQLTILLLLFILYNLPHLYIRIHGFWRGYRDGYKVCRILKMENFRFLKRAYMGLGLLCVGILAGLNAPVPPHVLPMEFLIFIVSIVTAAYLKVLKARTYFAMTIPILIALLLELITGNI